MSTICQLLEDAANTFGPKTALLTRRGYRLQRWSYTYLREFGDRAAAHLLETGLQRGDTVLVWAPNMPEWVALYFGCVRASIILVPLDIRCSDDFAARVKEQTDPRCVYVSRHARPQVETLGIPVRYLEELPDAVSAVTSDPGIAPPDENDTAEVMFTSGTTGDPKGVVLTHGNVASNVLAATQIVPSRSRYRLLSLLPLSHMLEQTVGLLAPLSGGATVVYPTSRQPRVIFSTLQQQRITTLLLVPQVLQLFWNAIEQEVSRRGKDKAWHHMLGAARRLPMPLRRLLFRSVHRQLGGSLEFIMCGGAYLDPELVRNWELLGIPVLQGYGTTEAAPIVSSHSPHDRKADSVGVVLPGQEAKVGEDGEILIRGPNVTQGYWWNPDATEAAFENGWYRTGDLGYFDADGHMHLRGRKKDVIVLDNGMNVYAQDVEAAIKENADVEDACVVGVPGRGRSVQVHAVLLLRDGAGEPKAIVSRANRHLAEHQRVQGSTVWPFADLPRTHTFKVKKKEVLEFVLKGSRAGGIGDAASGRAFTGTEILHRILAELADVSVEAILPSASLGDGLGLDSLRRIELLAAVEGEIGVYVDESQVGEATTVQELEEMVALAAPATDRPTFAEWPLAPPARIARAAFQNLVLPPVLRLIMPTVVEGAEHLERLRGPVVFAANHVSHADTPAVLRALPPPWRNRTAVAAAADFWFGTGSLRSGLAGLLFNAFPFSRTDSTGPSLEYCGRLLERGWSILIYPEGTRSTNGRMAPFKSGMGLMAVQLGVPVVPVQIQGTYEVLSRDEVWPRRGRVRVRFGEALRFAPGTPYVEATGAVEEAVRGLGATG